MIQDYDGEKWSPTCYLAKNDILVLEDLREQGFTLRSQETMDINSLKSAAATLARFHACSVLAERRLGKPLNEAFPTFFSEKICNNTNKFGQVAKVGYETQILMAKKFNLDTTFIVPNIYDYVSEMVRPQKGELNVVCHSDLYKYNIMFNGNNAALILDYQLLRYASPVIDLSLLLHLNTTPEFRKTSSINIMKHYYSVFNDTLQRSKLQINIPPYENMIQMYHKCKIVGMATSVDYLASLYLSPKLRFKIWNEEKVLERFLIHSRIDILGPELETNIDYARKMKNILCEYLDEAKRVLKL
ncbi:uncharacterized protein LOC131666810 [Phymastichus coffea]|uniref:uncharacterized protein LOC131666810 n=1 Tax=Phymastichus coffea TaxID=108790 RepID=UPI00273AF9B0|nr:uncharacterized protein LOC131666810 [Phymastichus coffea]